MKQTCRQTKPVKKTIIHLAVTMARVMTMGAGLYAAAMPATLVHAAGADNHLSDTQANNDHLAGIVTNETTDHDSKSNYLYPGLGIGAAAGTVIAGPVGLVVGGVLGAIIGGNQPAGTDVPAPEETSLAKNTAADNLNDLASRPADTTDLQVAQLGDIAPVVSQNMDDTEEKLLAVLTEDFSLDIYFRSGSARVEPFYPARLDAVAKLINSMPQLEIHLDGYSDRRGDRQQNQTLANKRIEEVRRQLIDAGVDESRIVATAFGEMKMVSAPGDLEGYAFDRKVVIRFEQATADAIHVMKQALSATQTGAEDSTGETAVTDDSQNESISPVAADAVAQF